MVVSFHATPVAPLTYTICDALYTRYAHGWIALVPELAASGATLVCFGSSSIVISDFAQLGPLDPQVISKRDTKFFASERQSPLEAFQAVKYLREYSLTALDATMRFLLNRDVAPQPALEAASRLALDMARPILEKINPYDLGAFALDSGLATEYCRRVFGAGDIQKNQKDANYRSLVETYPAHEFIIDRGEASDLGLSVAEPAEELTDLFDELHERLNDIETFVGLFRDEGEAS